MPRVSVGDGIEMYYQDVGAGRPVMLVHGGFMSHRVWEYPAHTLAEAGFRVITPDLRGHGESSKPDGSYTAAMHADDLAALLDTVGIETIDLVGWSLGSTVATTFATTYPARLRSLILLTSAVFNTLDPHGTDDPPETEHLVERIRANILKDRPQAMERFVTGMGVNLDEWTIQWLWGIAMRTPMHVGIKTLDLYRNLDRDTLQDGLTALTIPVGIFHGAHDRSTTITAAEAIATDLVRHGTYVQFDDSAHAPFLDQPTTFTTELLGFLPRVDGTPD